MKNTLYKTLYRTSITIIFVFFVFSFLLPVESNSFFWAHAIQESSLQERSPQTDTESYDLAEQARLENQSTARQEQNGHIFELPISKVSIENNPDIRTKQTHTGSLYHSIKATLEKISEDKQFLEDIPIDEHTHFDIFSQEKSFYHQISQAFFEYINLPGLQNYFTEYIVPQITTYSKNPKYTVYSGHDSVLTLTSKITAESRLGFILNEWVFHGNTANLVEDAKDLYDLASKLKIGQSYYVTIDINTNELLEFEYEIDTTNKIVVDLTPMLTDNTQKARIYKDTITYELKLEHVTGEIRGNFSNSAINVGENANFVNNFADVFSSDLDFSREIHNGDTFTALVEKRYRDGDFIGYGAILAAQLVNKGHTYNAYYFYESPLEDDPFAQDNKKNQSENVQAEKHNEPNAASTKLNENTNTNTALKAEVITDTDETDTIKDNDLEKKYIEEKTHTIATFIERPACVYFDEKGSARQKAFLRAPVHFTRVSSAYTMSRRHPILGVTRPHQGIDYAAPTGTPVYTVGDGVVTFVGWSGGYGKLIKVKHAGGLESQYAHLSRYASGLKVGARVLQGETIGFVGSTGLSTGPHLDFRIKKQGEFVNPDDIIIPSKAPVTPNRLDLYLETVAILNAYLLKQKPLSEYNPKTWLNSPAPPL